jgi:hypothetical protein
MKLLATLLFIALSPGLLLTIPPIAGKWYMTGKTSAAAILVHAVLFYLILMFKDSIPVVNMIEGFQGESTTGCEGNLNKAAGCPCILYKECKSGKCSGPKDDKKCE